MSNNKDGGPAFPQVTRLVEKSHQGISARDYFAAKAMQTLIGCVFDDVGDSNYIIDQEGRVSLHLRAYEHADAMLRARDA